MWCHFDFLPGVKVRVFSFSIDVFLCYSIFKTLFFSEGKMKKSILLVMPVLMSLILGDAYSQSTPPRGPRYNPPGQGNGHGGGGGQTTRPTQPTQPNRPTQPSQPTGPRYNPPGQGNGGGGHTTRPTQPRQPSQPTGPRYNPPGQGNGGGGHTTRPTQPRQPSQPTGPRYNPPGQGGNNRPAPSYTVRRPVRTYYNTPNYHRPHGYQRVNYYQYNHAPYRNIYRHSLYWNASYDYFNYIQRTYRDYVYLHWILWPTFNYGNGYYVIDGYPYFVYNNYRYRYSDYDYCSYQLVDKYTHQVVANYWNQRCNMGYDICSQQRDHLNYQSRDFRYMCAETYRDQQFDFNTASYNYNYSGQTCQGYECYDDQYDGSNNYGSDQYGYYDQYGNYHYYQ